MSDALDSLASAIHAIDALLGSRLAELLQRDARRTKMPQYGTDRHRLAVLIRNAKKSLLTKGSEDQLVHGAAAVELSILTHLLGTWLQRPGWASLARRLRDPGDYVHAFFTLLVADYFATRAPTPCADVHGSRIPDLIFEAPPVATLEIKAPRVLQRPAPRLTRDSARKLIKAALSDAASPGSGQVSEAHPGALVVGGFHLGARDLDALCQAAKERLSQRGQRRPMLQCIMFIWPYMLVDGMELGPIGLRPTAKAGILTPSVGLRMVLNPHYAGLPAIEFQEDDGGPTTLVEVDPSHTHDPFDD